MTAKGKQAGNLKQVSEDATDVVQIAFVEDGLTAFGTVWYRGQELAVERDSEDWNQTVNPSTGESWLEFDEEEQIERWGKRFFRHGKWVGKGYDLDDPELTEQQREQLRRAVEAEREANEAKTKARQAKADAAAAKPAPRGRPRKQKQEPAPPLP